MASSELVAVRAGIGARDALESAARQADKTVAEYVRERLNLPPLTGRNGRPRKRPLPDEGTTV